MWAPTNLQRHVTNAGPQLTPMIKKRHVTNSGPQLVTHSWANWIISLLTKKVCFFLGWGVHMRPPPSPCYVYLCKYTYERIEKNFTFPIISFEKDNTLFNPQNYVVLPEKK